MRTHALTTRRTAIAMAATAALALTLAACGDTAEDTPGEGTETTDDTPEDDSAAGEGGTVTLGYLGSWTDGLAMAYITDHFLTEAGYDVVHEDMADAGVLYTALADGALDIYPSAWWEDTHSDYREQFEDSLEGVSSYYEGAIVTLAVPEYTDIDSIADLADNGELFDYRVTGIEAGSGHMNTTGNEIFPHYGLDEAGWDLAESSTEVMLIELEQAIDAGDDIVVALWHPFWAYNEFDVKDLEDPDGIYEAEDLWFVGRDGFSEDFPEVADWMSSIQIDAEAFAVLDHNMTEYDDPAEGVQAWLDEYPDVIPPFN